MRSLLYCEEKKNTTILILVIFVFTFFGSPLIGQQDYSRQDALKVLALIEKIISESEKSAPADNRMVGVTEPEFNAYIAHRIATEQEQVMKELQFKLFNDDRIEGKLYFDLKDQDLPKLLRPEMTFYFSGTIESNNGVVRLDLDELFLEDQKIQPVLLDIAFYFVAKIGNYESGSINDWYVLPFGIREVKIFEGKAEFYY